MNEYTYGDFAAVLRKIADIYDTHADTVVDDDWVLSIEEKELDHLFLGGKSGPWLAFLGFRSECRAYEIKAKKKKGGRR